MPAIDQTLDQVLRLRARQENERPHLVLLEEDRRAATLGFADLLEGAERVAGGIQAAGVGRGDAVSLMLPTGSDFFFGFMGVLLAGAIPVPIYPPVKIDQIEEYAERQVHILRNAGAKALLTPRRATKLARLLQPRVPSLEAILRPDRLLAGRALDSAPEVEPDDLALIQYTSGSTGDPKGVALSHTNLIANIRSIGEAVGVNDDDVVVSWLPLYHDMGLTLSPAPNFAYELCVRRIRDKDLKGLDLSSWRVALNGAEPVNPDTVERFAERFRPFGFRPGVMMPVYGLAENAVALTFPPVGRPARIEQIERDTFHREGRAAPTGDERDDGAEPLRCVSVGSPIPAHEIRLVDDDERELGERVEGNIQFRGPSVTPGYYRNPEASAGLRTADGWTRTGDRGYLADGELFITGRRKDLIIKGGRNLDPAEVEALAAQVDGIRRGCVAAIGVPNPTTGSEDLIVIAETRRKEPEQRRRLVKEARQRIRKATRISPDTIVLVPPRTLPKTPSGKLRRAETRGRYQNKTLRQRRPPVWLQIGRLTIGAVWVALLAVIWRRRSHKRREADGSPGDAMLGE